MAEKAGWSETEQLVVATTHPFLQVGSTEIVEDGFRQLRHAEQHESGAPKAISAKRRWTTLIDGALERDVHRYAPLHFASEALPRGAHSGCIWVGRGQGPGTGEGLANMCLFKWVSVCLHVLVWHTALLQ